VSQSKRNIKIKQEDKSTEKKHYVFQLFVAGSSANSSHAIKNITSICEQYFRNSFKLEIIDVNKKPAFVITENIISLPLLIKKLPLPEEKIIGDLSDTKKVLDVLNILI